MTPTSPQLDDRAIASRHGEPTWEVAQLYPRQADWTEADYLELDAAGGRLVELSDGVVEFRPMPGFVHQFLFEFLFDALRAYLKTAAIPGRVLSAPFPVKLRPGKFREPDIVHLRPERIVDLRRQPEGADLVLEIVSGSAKDRERDFEKKRAEYAQAGIPEYWIVDPETRSIHVLTLDGVEPGGAYRVHGVFKPGETATSLLLPGFAVPVTDCFAAGESLPKDAGG
jgi:Uma2 family endonuclease